MSTITEADVIKALEGVKDPDLGKDLVELGMIKDITSEGSVVSLTVDLTTPACPLKDQIGNDVKTAIVSRIEACESVNVNFTSTVRPGQEVGSDLLPGVKNVVLIGSGKGGVGKSTVSVNVACALAQTGASVGILDADIYGPSIPTAFGIVGERPEATEEQRILPVVKFGMKLMSMGMLLDEGQPAIWRGPMLDGALRQFLGQVEWGELDYLVIDLPPGTGDVQLSLSRMVPQAFSVIVTTPQDIALADVKRAHTMFKQVNINTIGVVENMSAFICENCNHETHIFMQGGGQKAADLFGCELFGEIPLSARVAQMTDGGTPLVIEDPQDAVSEKLKEVAGRVAQHVAIEASKRAEQAPGVTGAAMPESGDQGHRPIGVPSGAPKESPSSDAPSQGFSRF